MSQIKPMTVSPGVWVCQNIWAMNSCLLSCHTVTLTSHNVSVTSQSNNLRKLVNSTDTIQQVKINNLSSQASHVLYEKAFFTNNIPIQGGPFKIQQKTGAKIDQMFCKYLILDCKRLPIFFSNFNCLICL